MSRREEEINSAKVAREKLGKGLSRRTKKESIGFFIALSFMVILFLSLKILFSWALQAGISQPLAFNHKIHIENKMDCPDCHSLYKAHASSGKPTLETCASCHNDPLGNSPEEKKLIEYIKEGKEIDWQRIYRLPEDVFFSHRRHVVLGKIECSICHGNIAQATEPPSKPIKITMKKCMNCHEENKADNDCLACHR